MQLFTRPSQFSQVSGIPNHPDKIWWLCLFFWGFFYKRYREISKVYCIRCNGFRRSISHGLHWPTDIPFYIVSVEDFIRVIKSIHIVLSCQMFRCTALLTQEVWFHVADVMLDRIHVHVLWLNIPALQKREALAERLGIWQQCLRGMGVIWARINSSG